MFSLPPSGYKISCCRFKIMCLCHGPYCLIIHLCLHFFVYLIFLNVGLCDCSYIVPSFSVAIFLHQDEVTIGLEVLLPKEAKLHSETSSPLQYDVFLYKVANNGDSASPSQAPHTRSATSNASQPIPKSATPPMTPKSAKVPKSPKSPKNTKEHSSNHDPLPGRHSSPCRHPSPGRHPSPSHHSTPSGSHHSLSHNKCMPTSSTPPQFRRPRGRSLLPGSECSGTGREYQTGHIRPSPSSPHLTQPPPSPSRVKYSPVSTRSLPLLS